MARTSAILIAALLVLLAAALEAEAVTCKVTELMPCMSAFQGGSKPTQQCCNKLNEQEPCLCGYIKDPTLKKYWDTPQAKNIAKACGIPYPPKC